MSYDTINCEESVVAEVTSRREEIDGSMQRRITMYNKHVDEYPVYVLEAKIEFSVGELLDPERFDGEKFKKCARKLYPLYVNPEHERKDLRRWWYPLMTYFIETNQLKKYKIFSSSIGYCDRDAADYSLLLGLVCKFKPEDFVGFFGYTFKHFCFGFTPNGRHDPVKIDGSVLERADMRELAEWIYKMGCFDQATNVVSHPDFGVATGVSEEKQREMDDDVFDCMWENWWNESMRSLKAVVKRM